MDAIFTQLISQLNSSVFVLLGILALAFYATMKIGEWKQTFLHHSGRIEKTEKISDIVVELKTKIDLIYQFTNPNIPTRSASPISLTDVGRQIVEKMDAETIFKTHEAKLVSMVEAEKPKNAYDIQQASFLIVKKELVNLLTEAQLLAVKDEAYKRGLLVEDILSVFGILLRNKILADKNIPIADVDKHAK